MSRLVRQSLGNRCLRVDPNHAGFWCVGQRPWLVAWLGQPGSRHGVGAFTGAPRLLGLLPGQSYQDAGTVH